MFKFTIFEVKNKNKKFPESIYDDNTFIFRNVEVQNLFEASTILANHFTLNLPINISNPIKIRRRFSEIKPFMSKEYNYLILDFDISNHNSYNETINKLRKYKCSILKSRSNNNFDNFNIKVIIETEQMTYDVLKPTFYTFREQFKDVKLSTSSLIISEFTASINKLDIVEICEGEVLKPSIKKNSDFYINPNIKIKFNCQQSLNDKCFLVFKELGFLSIDERTFSKDDEKYYWYPNTPYILHNRDITKSVNIYQIIKNEIQTDFDKIITLDDYKNKITLNNSVFKVDNFNVEGFLNNRKQNLILKSPMGTGKSLLIKDIVHKAKERQLKIICVTHRISVAEDFKVKYDLDFYRDVNLSKHKKSLIVQFDSLHKVDIKQYDLVIFDEFVSLMFYSLDPAVKNTLIFNKNIINLFELFKKKLIISDAFITGFESQIVNKPEKDFVVIDNNYRDNTKIIDLSKDDFIKKLLNINTQNATISCSTKKQVYELAGLLEANGIKTQILTGDTKPFIRNFILNEFNNIHNKNWKVLIYSSAVTVGISNLNNCDIHFHYDDGSVLDVVSSLQMIKRTRKAKEIYCYVQNKVNSFKNISNERLRNNIIEKNLNCLLDLNKSGELILSKNGKIAFNILKYKNILDLNHKQSFVYLSKLNFKNYDQNTQDNKVEQNNYNLIYPKFILDDMYFMTRLFRFDTEMLNIMDEVLNLDLVELYFDFLHNPKIISNIIKNTKNIEKILDIDKRIINNKPKINELCLKYFNLLNSL